MTQVDAIYQNGVFKPMQEVALPENQRVGLSVQPIEAGDVRAWLAEVQERRQRIIARGGTFSDSTLDIAEDRRRCKPEIQQKELI
jgi:predicted DNA-binding antitoxin AbrB/MazE fold protein